MKVDLESADPPPLQAGSAAKALPDAAIASARVLLQQDCIPHYRLPIFRALSDVPGLQMTFVSDPEGAVPYLRVENGRDHGLRCFEVKTKLTRLLRGYEVTWQVGAVRVFLSERPDVLIAQGSFNSVTTWALCLLARAYRIPVLLWGHGLLKEEGGLRWMLRSAFYRLANGHLLYGDYARRLLSSKGFARESIHVVYNSLDYDRQVQVRNELKPQDIAGCRERLGVEQGQGMVVFTGRLQERKRLDMLLHALSMLSRVGRVVHVALVGDGSERHRLEALGRTLGIHGQVHFLGAIYDERRLGEVIGAADLAVIPSGAGLSVMHAMTFGTPVLLHDRVECHFPEWEAVQEGVTGFFYRFGSVSDMAQKISDALFPQPRKRDMAACCKAVIEEKYNPHRQVEIIVAAVRGVMDAKRVGER